MKSVCLPLLLVAILVVQANCCDNDRECEVGQCCKRYVGGIVKRCQDLKLQDQNCKGTFYCDCARGLECISHQSRFAIGDGRCQRPPFNP